ncbi:hypothetical protein Nepgr_006787 [Nepenthes gracilis]|uniref:Uncharacterized protein n=1 Tax=Nepenthes gracilis TaxID=150966 RepID=A0AAD3XHN2_NEPGR|nr:hypothetical protein Nepgr_006787 [Nepenthes gracilis]
MGLKHVSKPAPAYSIFRRATSEPKHTLKYEKENIQDEISSYWGRIAGDAMGVLLSFEARRMSPRPLCTWMLLPVPWWWFWPNDVEEIHVLWHL